MLACDIDPDARIDVRLDSKLVVEQMSGRWKIKSDDIRSLALRARDAHDRQIPGGEAKNRRRSLGEREPSILDRLTVKYQVCRYANHGRGIGLPPAMFDVDCLALGCYDLPSEKG